MIGAYPAEVIFTSGATESNNLAILGTTRVLTSQTKRRQLVTKRLEHKAVLEPLQELEREGFSVQYLPVLPSGRVDLEAAAPLIGEQTLLVSVQGANNEIGTVQPIPEIAALAREGGDISHCDAAQAVGKIPIDVDALDVDLRSLSAHKLYDSKGVGALYIRGGGTRYAAFSLMGRGRPGAWLRSGTLNVPGIVGLGETCVLCERDLAKEQVRISALRDDFEHALLRFVPDLHRNGDLEHRLPHSSSLTFPGVDAEALIANLPDLVLSTGSACTSGALEPSYVLQAIRMSREDAYSTVRVGIGRSTTLADLDRAVSLIKGTLEALAGLTR